MVRELFSLAAQGTLRRKRVSVITFLVLLLSFSCAILSLSLTESISGTNEAYRLNTFGSWYLAIPDGMDGDAEWLAQQSWAEEVGSCRSYGYVARSGEVFGSMDKTCFELSNARMLEGRLPRSDDEVALPEELLEELGLSEYTLGQKVTLSFSVYCRDENRLAISGGEIFSLCGVYRGSTDYWFLGYNKQDNRPVTVIMTDERAQDIYDTLEQAALRVMGKHLRLPSQQFYVYAGRDARREAIDTTKKHMQSTRNIATQDVQPCVNLAAYPNEEAAVSSSMLYSLLIAAVALAAVLCVFLMQLPAEVHRFAVLRSIGITKGQLLLLGLLEALLLVVPAVLLGIPLGAGLTSLALRLTMYSGSVPVQVAIPYDALTLLFLLWLGVIVLARLVIFFVTVRTPLTGRMQLQAGRARASRRFRRALIALLLTAFCAVLLYVVPQAADKYRWLDYYKNDVSYTMYSIDFGLHNSTVPEELRAELENIPGVVYATGSMDLWDRKVLEDDQLAAISFEGFAEKPVRFRLVEYRTWADTLRLSEEDAQRFERGDIVLLCFASQDDIGVLPQGDITVHALDANGVCVGEAVATPLVWVEPKGLLFTQARIYRDDAYSIICSKAYLDRLTSTFGPTTKWNGYAAGDTSGYRFVDVMADSNAEDLSTAYAVEELCRQWNLQFQNVEENRAPRVQSFTQELILLIACGGCVALVTLFLLTSALAIETEQERRSFTILRVIGMSAKQMHRKVLGKAFARGAFSIAAGWALVVALNMWTRMRAFGKTLAEVFVPAVKSTLQLNDSRAAMLALLVLLLAALLGVSLFAKRGLKEGTRLK